jgi:hypothetical protein
VRGDIGNYLAPKQKRLVGRLGLDAILPLGRGRLSVHVADYVARLRPGYESGEQLSPMHTLVISGGVGLGR